MWGARGLALVGVLAGGLGGCASPGRPLPPSLRLPAVVTDLRAERVGDGVELRWTMPTETTDGVTLKGAVETEICRETVRSAAGCTVVRKRKEAPGAAAVVVDGLPAELTVEPVGALVYRVRLRNGAGHDAGLSNEAFAASGRAPAAVLGVDARSDVRGVRLRWAGSDGPAAAMEIRRTEVAGKGSGGTVGRGGAGRQGAAERGVEELVVDAGAMDPGGAVDGTAMRDESYSYVLTRVRTVGVAGQNLRLRGASSAAVVVAVKDMAAPAVPQELVAAVDGMGVSLSWEPGFEADLAGYRVYRAAVGGDGRWVLLNEKLLAVPGFRDVVPGAGEFRYRVTAVDGSGNESEAGVPVTVRVVAP